MASNISLHEIRLAFATDSVDVSGSTVELGATTLAALENITVSATDLDIRDLAFATDSVTAHQGGSWVLSANSGVDIGDVTINNAAGAAAVNIQDGGNSITVDGTVELGATTLAALETINAVQSGTWTVEIGSTSLAALESITVSATDLDIRDLSHASDSIKVGDGTDFLAVNNDGSINAVVSGTITAAPDAYDVWQSQAKTVTSTASQLDGTPLANRLSCIVQNLSSNDIYLGQSNAVTTSTGVKVPKHGEIAVDFGASAQIWAIAASGSNNVRFVELAS